jgi:hypothetical protein
LRRSDRRLSYSNNRLEMVSIATLHTAIKLMLTRAFIGQCPLLLLSIVLVWWRLEEPHQNIEPKQSIWTKLKRIDFIGAFFMSAAILACITAFDLGSKTANTPVLVSLIAIGVTAGVFFVLTEKFWAKEPIFPLELLGKDAVITSYTIIFIQTGIQVAVSVATSPLLSTCTEISSSAHVLGTVVLPGHCQCKYGPGRRTSCSRCVRKYPRWSCRRCLD